MSSTNLLSSADPLTRCYDVALLDLDGVVYVGPDAVAGVPAALASAREQGMRLAFVTNNAARTPTTVAEHLTRLGVPARPEEVTTSSQAAAHYLADRLEPGSVVLVVGTIGLEDALTERGLRPVYQASDDVAAVVQGYSPDLDWKQLAEGAVAIRRGVPWVATNLDPTVPSPRGPLPGNGALVASLRLATGVEPVSTGKPDPTMHRESVQRSHAERPIVVGDRLDTDIEGANTVGCASLLVLSGVTVAQDLLSARASLRPNYLSPDVSGLLQPHVAPEVDGDRATLRGWRAVHAAEHGLALERTGDGDDPDGLDGLRALCGVAWQQDPRSADDRVQVTATGDDATQLVARLELGH